MKNKISLKQQHGFAYAFIFGAMAILALVAYLGSTVYTAILGGNQKTSLITQNSIILTQSSYIIITETTKNASGIPIAKPFLANSFSPTSGGIIPTSSASPKIDAFGSLIGYCVNSNPSSQSDAVFSIISAGPDKIFNTNCTQALANTVFGDDKIITKTVANILQGVGGTVYFGDPVPTVTSLSNLSTVNPGQLRIVLEDNSIWINPTGAIGVASWKKAVANPDSGGSTGTNPSVMYLVGMPNYNSNIPAACPSTWTEVGYKPYDFNFNGTQVIYKRTCTNSSVYSVLYLDGLPDYGAGNTPEGCPTNWIQADYKAYNLSSTGNYLYRRTCFFKPS